MGFSCIPPPYFGTVVIMKSSASFQTGLADKNVYGNNALFSNASCKSNNTLLLLLIVILKFVKGRVYRSVANF